MTAVLAVFLLKALLDMLAGSFNTAGDPRG